MDERNQNSEPTGEPQWPLSGQTPPVIEGYKSSRKPGTTESLFQTLGYTDLTKITKWIIALTIIFLAIWTCATAIIWPKIVAEDQPRPVEFPGAPGFFYFGGIGLAIVAGVALLSLTIIWFNKSTRNLRILPESRYPYSPGLTLGLIFIPYFNAFWVWRVITREADALVRAKTAREMDTGGLERIRPRMVIYLAYCCVSLTAYFGTVILTFADISHDRIILFVSLPLGLFAFVAIYCLLRSMWDITLAMRDIKQAASAPQAQADL